MNVTITNINDDTLTAIETLLKPFIKKNKMKIIKEDSEVEKAIKEYESEKESKQTKTYDTFADFKKAMSV